MFDESGEKRVVLFLVCVCISEGEGLEMGGNIGKSNGTGNGSMHCTNRKSTVLSTVAVRKSTVATVISAF